LTVLCALFPGRCHYTVEHKNTEI